MNKSDLVNILAERCSFFEKDDCEQSVRLVLDSISSALSVHRRVEIRGFGSFDVNFFQARTARNPRSGESVQLAERYTPYFRAGKEMRERVITGDATSEASAS